MVAVREVSTPPPGEEPIEWLLWTTEPARTKKQILAVVRTYALRWRIEDFHLVWKQGCRVEQLQLQTRERLEKALIVYAGVAVRLLRLRDLARQEPGLLLPQLLHAPPQGSQLSAVDASGLGLGQDSSDIVGHSHV